MFLSPGSRARSRPKTSYVLKNIVGQYHVTETDNGTFIPLGGSAFYTVTLDVPMGYPLNFSVTLINTDSGRGKTIAPNGATSFILWPNQSVTISRSAGTWQISPIAQPWNFLSVPTINVNPAGNDNNDGLASGTTNAVQTLNRAATLAYTYMFNRNLGTVLIDGGSNTFQEFVQINYQVPGAGLVQFQNFTWKPANSSYCLQIGDNALILVSGINFSSAGTTTPVGFITMHQASVLDLQGSGNQVTPTVGIAGDFIGGDACYRVNVNGGLTINAGTISGFLYNAQDGASFNINGTHQFNGTPTINRFCWASMCGRITFQGNVTFSGANTTSTSIVNQNGVIRNLSGATLPGGTPTSGGGTILSGGQYQPSTTT